MAIYIIRGVLHPWKKMSWYVIRGQCRPSIRVCQPSADNNGSLAPFLFELKLLRRVWQPSADNKVMVCQKAITICRGLSHLSRSFSRIVSRGQEHPKGRQGTSRPDIQALGFFLKPMSPQDTKRKLWGNPGIVSLRQFRDNEARIQLEQKSPLMNKKGLRSQKTSCRNCSVI